MLNLKQPRLALVVVLLWLGAVLAALGTAALFFFPIRYDERHVVAEKARTPLTAARSPLLLWGMLVFVFLLFCIVLFVA